MTTGSRKEQSHTDAWAQFVEECYKTPMGVELHDIQRMLDQLNAKTLETRYAFDLHQVIDGFVPPNVADAMIVNGKLEQPQKYDETGPVIEALLQKLPQAVRSGSDEIFEAYQIRLDDYDSFEHAMGTTTLLTTFLMCRNKADACYFFPNSPDCMTNWNVIVGMHAELYPTLGKGGSNV